MTDRMQLLNDLKRDSPRVWEDGSFDAPTFYTAMEYIREKKPRVVFLSLGETDDWAHVRGTTASTWSRRIGWMRI